jgi:calcineurin-like phosphoesterase family protein
MKKLSFRTTNAVGKIYFTSDLHIAHGKPFIIGPRKYATVEAAIEHTFSELGKLTSDDVLFNLGDLVVGAGEQSEAYAKRVVNLPCQQYYIHGNHCAGIANLINIERAKLGLLADDVELYPLTLTGSRFTVLGHYAEIFIDGVPIVLSHYPMTSWNHMSKGGYMLHGHCHRNLRDEPGLKRLDVGWDWKKRPVEWEEVRRELNPRKSVVVDHHGKPDDTGFFVQT